MALLRRSKPDPATVAGRVVHDLGLAALMGGTLFGRLALHPAVRQITDARERGQVVNGAWRRYGVVNALGLAAVTGGWLAHRGDEGGDARLVLAKDVLVGTVGVLGMLTAAEGIGFARQAPAGAVPLEDGDTPAASATVKQKRTKRVLDGLGRVTLAAEIALVGVNAALD
jgi:hypothetical protein